MRLDVTQYLNPFYSKHAVCHPAFLNIADHTYSADESLEKSWIPIIFRAFSKIASITQVRDVLIIGTGIGLDALGAIEIFDLNSITLTDISEDVVSIARENIISNINERTAPEIHFYIGDLFSCLPSEQQFSLVCENLPTVPAPEHINLRDADNAANYFDMRGRSVPESIAQYLLASHYLCLRDAYNRVRLGGGVLTSVGGRVPFEVVSDLHRLCGYSPQLVAFDLKIQSEPGRILPSYCAAEEAFGVSFKFYIPDALNIVAFHRTSGLDGQELYEAVSHQLEAYALSAREALDLFRQGKSIAHSAFMLFGQRLGSE